MPVREISTKPYPDQKFGTAGLRKKVAVFQQPHYLENLLQSVFDCAPELKGRALVVGGDGRYHNRAAIQTAIAMAAANGIRHIIVGQGGLLSTPAVSHLIRARKAAGGFILTASHNPAGPDGDFGIKLNLGNGGQAGEALTDRIYETCKNISRYRIADGLYADLDRRGTQAINGIEIEVVDCVEDYAALMQSLFDFDRIRDWLKKGHTLRFDAMHAVTGPYAEHLFCELLGAPVGSVINASPLEDFGGSHPDPNLIYAKPLVDVMMNDGAPDFGAASDGDGDRNMIIGRGLFVSPGDSLAMLAANLHLLPGYKRGLAGVARSMPTCRALDKVAQALNIPCHETPTGWKFFCSLLDANQLTLCGEESFGTSSNHVREKDGVWAVLAWLNVLATTGKSVQQIAQEHWRRFGRHYYARHDYDELPTTVANKIMQELLAMLPTLVGQTHQCWTITQTDEFNYTDPVDGSTAQAQGIRIVFGDAARIVLRLSGTGTKGATLRVYLERFEQNEAALNGKTNDLLAPLAVIADKLARIGELSARKAPSVVT